MERARTLWMGRWHRNGSPHYSVNRRDQHLAQPAGNGRADPACPDAGLLAARRERLNPGDPNYPDGGGWLKPLTDFQILPIRDGESADDILNHLQR